MHSKDLWEEVNKWIVELGMVDNNMSDMKIIVGDLENALVINSLILHTKTVIYDAMKKEQKTHIINVKYKMKNFYYQEKYIHYIKGKKTQFEKQYNLLCNLCEEKD